MTSFTLHLRCAVAFSLVVKTPCGSNMYKRIAEEVLIERVLGLTVDSIDDMIDTLSTPRNIRGTPLGEDAEGLVLGMAVGGTRNACRRVGVLERTPFVVCCFCGDFLWVALEPWPT